MKKCPICNTTKLAKQVLIPKELNIYTCKECELKQSDMLRKGHAGYEFHDDHAYENSIGEVRKMQAKKIVTTLKSNITSRGLWLDIGCGVGYLLQEAKKARFTILGIDPDPVACQKARRLFNSKLIKQELFNPKSVKDHSVDVISALDLFEHIPTNELDSFLDLVHKKLKAGGVYIIKLPTSDGLYFRIIHLAHHFFSKSLHSSIRRIWLTEYEYPHTVYFNAKSLRKILVKHGFDIITEMYLEEIPNRTIINRIRVDNSIGKTFAILALPIFICINAIEKIRGKSDALLVISKTG